MLPDRIAFPCLAQCVLGVDVTIPSDALVEAFISSLSVHESQIFHQAMRLTSEHAFPQELLSELVGTLSRFNCREIPRPMQFQQLISQVAH